MRRGVRRDVLFWPEACFGEEPEPVDLEVPAAFNFWPPERSWLRRRLRRGRGLAALGRCDLGAADSAPSIGPGSTRTPGASSANTGCVAPWIRVVVGAMPAARVELPHVVCLLTGHDGDDGAGVSRPSCTPGAMQVRLVLGRGVSMHNQGNVVDVDPACCDVSGDQRCRATIVERLEVASTRVLGEVSMQLDRRNATLVELAGQHLGATLGASEDDGATGRADQVDQDRQSVFAIHMQHVVRHLADRRLRGVGLVSHRVYQELPDERVDRPVERGREKEPLAVAGRLPRAVGAPQAESPGRPCGQPHRER